MRVLVVEDYAPIRNSPSQGLTEAVDPGSRGGGRPLHGGVLQIATPWSTEGQIVDRRACDEEEAAIVFLSAFHGREAAGACSFSKESRVLLRLAVEEPLCFQSA